MNNLKLNEIMKYTNLLLIALTLVLFASCGAKEDKKEPKDDFSDEQVIDVDNDTAQYPVDFENEEIDNNDVVVDTVEEQKVEEKVVKVREVKPVEKPKVVTKKHQKRYYIVVGSFKKFNNAKKLNSYFKSKGYKPMVLPRTNEFNRVAIVSYVKEAEARRAIKKLKAEHNNYTFWLYRW